MDWSRMGVWWPSGLVTYGGVVTEWIGHVWGCGGRVDWSPMGAWWSSGLVTYGGVVAEWIGHVWGRGGRVDWSLGIQCCGRGFESQWQWVRSAIITEAVFRSFLITPRWFPRVTLAFPRSIKKKSCRSLNSKMVTLYGGRLSAHLLSLHNRVGVAGSRSALTSHRLK